MGCKNARFRAFWQHRFSMWMAFLGYILLPRMLCLAFYSGPMMAYGAIRDAFLQGAVTVQRVLRDVGLAHDGGRKWG